MLEWICLDKHKFYPLIHKPYGYMHEKTQRLADAPTVPHGTKTQYRQTHSSPSSSSQTRCNICNHLSVRVIFVFYSSEDHTLTIALCFPATAPGCPAETSQRGTEDRVSFSGPLAHVTPAPEGVRVRPGEERWAGPGH